MMFIFFAIAAAITVAAAVKLSTYADVISEKSKLGGMMVGTLLLAGATSLPEVTTSLTAVFLDNPDIAIGNVLGSNMFNLLIIAVFDLVYRKERLFSRTSFSHVYTASIGMFLASMVLFAFFIKTELSILGIGLDSLIILLFYILGMYMLNKKSDGVIPEEGNNDEDGPSYTISLRHAVIGFMIAAIVILGAGSLLTITGDKIAVQTGLGSSFVGSFLIAASTSLPEAIAVLVALQLNNHNLALGSILGSNLFNIILLTVSDIGYRHGPIIAAAEPIHQITASAVIVLSAIVLFAVLRGRQKAIRLYPLPSTLLVIVYFISSYLIFVT